MQAHLSVYRLTERVRCLQDKSPKTLSDAALLLPRRVITSSLDRRRTLYREEEQILREVDQEEYDYLFLRRIVDPQFYYSF
jgi:hypothetical protein